MNWCRGEWRWERTCAVRVAGDMRGLHAVCGVGMCARELPEGSEVTEKPYFLL